MTKSKVVLFCNQKSFTNARGHFPCIANLETGNFLNQAYELVAGGIPKLERAESQMLYFMPDLS
jgi:hypothetical protein